MNTATTNALSETVQVLSNVNRFKDLKETLTTDSGETLVKKVADVLGDIAIIGTAVASVSNPELAVVSQLLSLSKDLIDKKLVEEDTTTATDSTTNK